jgi:hypothetical protein
VDGTLLSSCACIEGISVTHLTLIDVIIPSICSIQHEQSTQMYVICWIPTTMWRILQLLHYLNYPNSLPRLNQRARDRLTPRNGNSIMNCIIFMLNISTQSHEVSSMMVTFVNHLNPTSIMSATTRMLFKRVWLW